MSVKTRLRDGWSRVSDSHYAHDSGAEMHGVYRRGRWVWHLVQKGQPPARLVSFHASAARSEALAVIKAAS